MKLLLLRHWVVCSKSRGLQSHGLTLHRSLLPGCSCREFDRLAPAAFAAGVGHYFLRRSYTMKDCFKSEIKVPFGRRNWNASQIQICQMLIAVIAFWFLTCIFTLFFPNLYEKNFNSKLLSVQCRCSSHFSKHFTFFLQRFHQNIHVYWVQLWVEDLCPFINSLGPS